MNIAVCLKFVPDPATVEVDPLTGAIMVDRLLYVINPADEAALELGLRLREDSGKLLALTVGADEAQAALRTALAVGADRVMRVWDAGLQTGQSAVTALLLAAALRAERLPDLVLCGARSADQGSGAVPALIAGHLGWPVITDVTRLEVRQEVVSAQRRLERGAREEVETTLPAVVAIEPGLAHLRYADLPGLMAAQRATIPVCRPFDLGLTPADLLVPAPVLRGVGIPRPRPRPIFTPDSTRQPHERIDQILSAGITRKAGRMLEGPPDEMAAAIIDFLRQRGFVADDQGRISTDVSAR